MKIEIPSLALVVLIGASGSGKSSFAREHFLPTEIVSSDTCRGMVSDDENDQSATDAAFALLHFIARQRLAAGKLTVIDATNVEPIHRKPLLALAREFYTMPVALVFDLPERICHERNARRPNRAFGPHVVRRHIRALRGSIRSLQRDEGFRTIAVFRTPEEVAGSTIVRTPLWNDRRDDRGPFDIIGDIHGCADELDALLERLGYLRGPALAEGDADATQTAHAWHHPDGRRAIFLGDLVDRGPQVVRVLRTAMAMAETGQALCLPGNHDVKLMRKLNGRDVKVAHGLAETLEQLADAPPEFTSSVAAFLDRLVGHYVLDGGRLVVAHAGMKAEMQGRAAAAAREFALYGETTGETDEFGLPVRYNWASEYRGKAAVVYGHTPIPEPEWLNNTINIDTGCVFGGRLSALRYPEREIVSVPAARIYAVSARPFLLEEAAAALTAQQRQDELLDLADVTGKRLIETRLAGRVTVREENATAALEVMSRFAANPKWLIYLPPTMSPSETSARPGYLEYPTEAFAHYRSCGVARAICQEKHMGSRAVAVVCADEGAARRRFGVADEGAGIIYTRTGRRFFDDAALERGVLDALRAAADAAGLWDELGSDWLLLDCELMPWSAKAQELLRRQYAPVGAASRAALRASVAAVDAAVDVTLGSAVGVTVAGGEARSALGALRERLGARAQMAQQYTAAYRRYCWPVTEPGDLRLAPFHLLASERGPHLAQDHAWHMAVAARLAAADVSGVVQPTRSMIVDLSDPASEAAATAWWEQLTEAGGEGMVVKPLEFIARDGGHIVQPAIKCRGREYLRIVYGPEYSAPENLERLRQRGLSGKRALAQREFALGVEALERFARHEPLRRVHECVFGVLALESQPVDPRL